VRGPSDEQPTAEPTALQGAGRNNKSGPLEGHSWDRRNERLTAGQALSSCWATRARWERGHRPL